MPEKLPPNSEEVRQRIKAAELADDIIDKKPGAEKEFFALKDREIVAKVQEYLKIWKS